MHLHIFMYDIHCMIKIVFFVYMFASFSNWCMYDVNGKAIRENLELNGFSFE